MSGTISGASGAALVGMTLLEAQQQTTREGRDFRDTAHELGMAQKKVESVYDGIAHAARKFEETTALISAGMSLYSVGSSAVGVGQKVEQSNEMAKMTPQQRAELQAQMDDQFRNPGKYESTSDKIFDMAKEGVSSFMSVSKQRMSDSDEANKKWAESMGQVSEKSVDLSDTIREQTQNDQELTNEMFKLGAVFKRVG